MFRLALHWQILIGVVVAAAAGILLNATVSTRESEAKLPDGTKLHVIDTANYIDIKILNAAGETVKGQHWAIDPTGQTRKIEYAQLVAGTVGTAASSPLEAVATIYPGRIKKTYPTLSLLKEKEKRAYDLFVEYGRSPARWVGDWANSFGQLFLRLLKMVSIPLIITSLATGVMGLADAGRLRKLFGITMTYYVTTSMLAICTGIVLVNLIQPGYRGVGFASEVEAKEVQGDLGEVLFKQVEALIPENPFEAVATSNFLSVIGFTILFSLFTILVGGRPLQLFRELAQAGFEVMMKLTMFIIHLAPFGVFFLMLSATATQGAGVFETLGWYMLTVFAGLVFHGMVTLPAIVWLFGRRNPLRYARAMAPALVTAFSSASSNATLPLTMNCVEERAGIDNRIGSFVLPLGATINMDGTALFEAVAVLFIAQMEPNINLTLGQQFLVAITALLASIGAAGIPHAGLVMMVIVLQAVGLPADRVGLILAVDRILDMCRTTVNVWSDMCGCAVVSRFETDLPPLTLLKDAAPPPDAEAATADRDLHLRGKAP